MHQNPGDGATEQAGVIEELNATIDTVVDLAVNTAKENTRTPARVKKPLQKKANEEKKKMNDLPDGNGAHYRNLQGRSVILSQISGYCIPDQPVIPECFY